MKVKELIKLLDELNATEQEKKIMFSDWERGPISVDYVERKNDKFFGEIYLIC